LYLFGVIYIKLLTPGNLYSSSVISAFEDPSVTVFSERFPQDELTVASFVWPEPNTPDTYTIAPNTGLSLELDAHYPVRLARIVLYDTGITDSIELLGTLASPELADGLMQGKDTAPFVMSITIQRASRLLLAQMQLASPSTPPHMRRACAAMLTANKAENTAPELSRS
jgi:hypothetical protein